MAATEDRLNENLRQVADGIRGARGGTARFLHILSILDGDEPVLSGPFDSELDRIEAAQDYRRAHGDETGLFRVNVAGTKADISRFKAWETHPPLNTKWVSNAWIDGRNAIVQSNGWYQLHAYDTDPEDDVPKRVGAAEFTHYSDARRAGERWTRDRVWCMHRARRVLDETPVVETNPVVDDDPAHVAEGDRVRDPFDGRWRTVARIEGDTAYMADGGCMNVEECRDIRLPGEPLS